MVNDVELLNAIKADMGLEGKGIGKRKYVKSGKPRKPRMTKKEKAKLEGGLGFKDLLRIPATAAKMMFPPAAIALKAVGLGKGKKPKNGAGFLDVLKMPLKLLGMGADGVAVEIPLEHAEHIIGSGMTGGANTFMNFLENLRKGYSMPHAMWKLYKELKPIVGKGYTAAGRKQIGNFLPSDAVVTASGQTAGKRKYVKKGKGETGGGETGGSFLDMASRIANFSPFTSMSADVAPLSHLLPKDLIRDVSVGVVEKMMGKGKKEKKENKVKRAVSPKVARRGALVKKLMKEKGFSVIEASKYIKAKGLKY